MPKASGCSFTSSDTLSNSLCPCTTGICSRMGYSSYRQGERFGAFSLSQAKGKEKCLLNELTGKHRRLAPTRDGPPVSMPRTGCRRHGRHSLWLPEPCPPEAGGQGVPGERHSGNEPFCTHTSYLPKWRQRWRVAEKPHKPSFILNLPLACLLAR